MWNKFRQWLHGFNLVAMWREERRLDREAQMLIVEEICSTLREQSAVATKALELSHAFLKNFETQEAPDAYVVREEDEVKAWLERNNRTVEDLDADYDS